MAKNSVRVGAPNASSRGWPMSAVLGVPITVQPGALLLAGLVTALLGRKVLPAGVPGAGLIGYWVGGLIVATLFVGSVLAHEHGHALVARRRGVPVDGIRMSVLGGVTDLPGRLPDPATAWRIAAAGPAVSATLGGVFYSVALVADSGGATLIGMGATWLAYSNFAIGVLNLLPGAPFDGGHLLSALLWRWSGDQDRSDHLAARAGQGLGLILLGAAMVHVASGALTGISVGVLGAFMLLSATAADHPEVPVPTPDPALAAHGALVRHR